MGASSIQSPPIARQVCFGSAARGGSLSIASATEGMWVDAPSRVAQINVVCDGVSILFHLGRVEKRLVISRRFSGCASSVISHPSIFIGRPGSFEVRLKNSDICEGG